MKSGNHPLLINRYNQLNDMIQATQKQVHSTTKIRLLAVSKYHPASDIRLLSIETGHLDFAESQVQEACDKIQCLNDLDLIWHFIGPIQSNKTRLIAEHFDWVHSLSRQKIAIRLNQQRSENLKPLNVCIQLKLGDEDSKSGLSLSELPEMADSITQCNRLKLRGLMCIPPKSDQFEDQKNWFRQVRLAAESLKQSGYEMDVLSMGMSGDMQAAIAEGSNMLRIGTALFGPRDNSDL